MNHDRDEFGIWRDQAEDLAPTLSAIVIVWALAVAMGAGALWAMFA